MTISKDGLDLIRHFESCLKPNGRGAFESYADPAHGWKVPTIGWGTVEYPDGVKVKRGDVISQERADELLHWEVSQKATKASELVKVKLEEHQLAALTAFAYNVGTGALEKSTLLKKLNRSDFDGAADEFLRWNRADGKVMRGLMRRRTAERLMFLGKPWR